MTTRKRTIAILHPSPSHRHTTIGDFTIIPSHRHSIAILPLAVLPFYHPVAILHPSSLPIPHLPQASTSTPISTPPLPTHSIRNPTSTPASPHQSPARSNLPHSCPDLHLLCRPVPNLSLQSSAPRPCTSNIKPWHHLAWQGANEATIAAAVEATRRDMEGECFNFGQNEWKLKRNDFEENGS